MVSNELVDTQCALTFIKDGVWNPYRSKEYGADCTTGRTYANEMLREIQRTENPALLGNVIRAIVTGGDFGAVETGFCAALSASLLAT